MIMENIVLMVGTIRRLNAVGFPAEIINGWLRYSMRDAIAVGHEYVLQEVIQALLILSKGRSGIPSKDVIAYLLQSSDDHKAALKQFNLLSEGENPLELKFRVLYERIELSTSADRITEGGLSRWNGPLTELGLIELVRAHPPRSLAILPVIWSLAAIRSSGRRSGDARRSCWARSRSLARRSDRFHPP